MTEAVKPPITVTVIIETPAGSFSVSKTQQFRSSANQRGRAQPLQSLSSLWKEAVADVQPFIRRHEKVNG